MACISENGRGEGGGWGVQSLFVVELQEILEFYSVGREKSAPIRININSTLLQQ